MNRLLYTLALWLLLPWALLHLLWRARRQPEYLGHWGERFGSYGARPQQPTIWLHAVSVGETRAAQPLVSALKQRYPDHRLQGGRQQLHLHRLRGDRAQRHDVSVPVM